MLHRSLYETYSDREDASFVRAHAKSQAVLEQVALKEVLDNLRIVIDAEWREIGGEVRWTTPPEVPRVWAEPHASLYILKDGAFCCFLHPDSLIGPP